MHMEIGGHQHIVLITEFFLVCFFVFLCVFLTFMPVNLCSAGLSPLCLLNQCNSDAESDPVE